MAKGPWKITYSRDDFANLFGISRRTLQKWIRDGTIDLSNLEQIVEVYIEKRARFQKLPEKNDSNLREERQLALPADAACAAEGDPDASS